MGHAPSLLCLCCKALASSITQEDQILIDNTEINPRIYRKDWQQCYWEAHLQECLREAAGQALIPSFEGSIANIILSDAILEHIGVQRDFTCMEKDTSTLKYHCQQFGQYARHLQLRNVLCVGELSVLVIACMHVIFGFVAAACMRMQELLWTRRQI